MVRPIVAEVSVIGDGVYPSAPKQANAPVSPSPGVSSALLGGNSGAVRSPAIDGERAAEDRNHEERDHDVLEERRSSLLDDPPAVVDGERGLDRKADESSRADKAQEFSAWIPESRRSRHKRR